MFEHEYFDVYPFEDVPLNRDCYLMDECYLQEYEASILEVFADKGGARSMRAVERRDGGPS